MTIAVLTLAVALSPDEFGSGIISGATKTPINDSWPSCVVPSGTNIGEGSPFFVAEPKRTGSVSRCDSPQEKSLKLS
jgi:hypothetical protein